MRKYVLTFGMPTTSTGEHYVCHCVRLYMCMAVFNILYWLHPISDEKPDHKWIVFDGPVDTLWIESMNSVMDDNKVLTLINGERISMPNQVTLLFEVEDLAVASPATVSRSGMVYNDWKNLGWKPFVQSWLSKRSQKVLTYDFVCCVTLSLHWSTIFVFL